MLSPCGQLERKSVIFHLPGQGCASEVRDWVLPEVISWGAWRWGEGGESVKRRKREEQ